ncbi:MAG: ribonuclease HI [Magnetococcales bacterium]|nr:ribonuclease HI [Magnetococcales bacterium]
MTVESVHIHTDGACRHNPGPGGWGALIQVGACEYALSGFCPETTNNRMELTAVIRSLAILLRPCQIRLTTDSIYVKDGITQWIHGWKQRQWRKSDGKPVLNIDLWQQLDHLSHQHQIHWEWVKGHSGHEGNTRVDTLARSAIELGVRQLIAPDPPA